MTTTTVDGPTSLASHPLTARPPHTPDRSTAYKPSDAGRRARRRLGFRAGDNRMARLEVDGQPAGRFRVRDLSLDGISLLSVADGSMLTLPARGTPAWIHLDWPEGVLALSARVERAELTPAGHARIALRLARTGAESEDIEAATVPLAPGATLTARFSRPLVFGQRVAADVVRLGRSALLLRIDDRSIVILPQLPLELELSGHIVRGRVLWTRTTARGLEFALALARLDRSTVRDLVEHLLLTTSATPRELRAAGLPTRAIRRLFECREVDSDEEYREVLGLRYLTYRAAKKLADGADVDATSSADDRMGRVLGFYHRDRLVASVALRFPDAGSPVESVARALGDTYPADLPPQRSLIEVTKLCIHPDYRGSDLMVGICEQICRILLASDRQWFLAAADRWLAPRYEYIRYRKTGHHYFRTANGYAAERTSKDDERIDVMVARPFRFGTFGMHSDPLRWNYFLRDVTEFSLRSGVLRWNILQRAARRLFSLFRPAVTLIERVFVK